METIEISKTGYSKKLQRLKLNLSLKKMYFK